MYHTGIPEQLIPHGCDLDEGTLTLVNLQEKLQVPGQADILNYQEGSDIESQYSAGTNSPDDQRSLSGTESSYEESQSEQSIRFQLSPIPLQIRSELSDSLLTNIPTELHLLIFSHLDPLDSACLGLTNAHFYNLQKALHGTIPLQAGHAGHTWELHRAQQQQQQEHGGYCSHCGPHFCQLHMHLRDWMPTEYEYCSIRQIYGLRAPDGGAAEKDYCYRSNPLKPGWCGRHPVQEEHCDD